LQKSQHPVFTVPKDGVYLLVIHMVSVDQKPFTAEVRVQMKGNHGYLSATEWPLLLVTIIFSPLVNFSGQYYLL